MRKLHCMLSAPSVVLSLHWTRDRQGRLVRMDATAAAAPSHHLLSLPVALLQHCVLSFLCDGDLDRTLALRVLCRRLRPLVEHHAVQWMQRVLPTLLSEEYAQQLALTAALSSPPAAAEEEMEDDCDSAAVASSAASPASSPARPGGLYELGDACWLSMEMRRWSVRDGRGGWIGLAVDEPQATWLYSLTSEELQVISSWVANRRYPGVYRHRMDVLHLALDRWSHASRLIDWQRGQLQAEQQLVAERAEWQMMEKHRYELKLAMRAAGLPWQVAQWNRLAPYQYRHGRVRLCWEGKRWQAEVMPATAAERGEVKLHKLMVALGLQCAGQCGWGSCGSASQMGQ